MKAKRTKIGSPNVRVLYPSHRNLHFMFEPLFRKFKDLNLLEYDNPDKIRDWLTADPRDRFETLNKSTGIGPKQVCDLFAAFDMKPPIRKYKPGLTTQIKELQTRVTELEKLVFDLTDKATKPSHESRHPTQVEA